MKSLAQNQRKLTVAAALGAFALTAAACSDVPNTSMDDSVGDMGNAQPVASPAAAQPAGDVIGFPDISDLEAAGDVLAVRAGDALSIGTAADFRADRAERVELDPACGELTATADAFVTGCGDFVLRIPAQSPDKADELAVTEEFPVTAATQISTGEVFVASNAAAEVAVYKDGQRIDGFSVQAPTDQLVAVRNQDGTDNVVRTWREDTTIQNLDWENNREGGRLRVGLGVGQISTANEGVIVASDTLGKRIGIYTAEDVVRLHQWGNVAGVPWATAWDPQRQLAWITSTDVNVAEGFQISNGVPEKRTQFDTVADAQHLAATADGTLAVGSATGGGLQLVGNDDLNER